MIFRSGGFWLAGLACAATLGACVGVSSEVGTMTDAGAGGEAAGGGDEECAPGEMKPVDDGCNSCTCNEVGRWRCTGLDCNDVCTEGEVRAAGDGCNTCTCLDGEWACTIRDCQTCTIGETRNSDCGSCWCADNGSGPTWNCTSNTCPPECTAGETKPADDGCNTCTCTTTGTWNCTDTMCPECRTGDTMPAGDDCNTCTCMSGQWGCTMKYCSPLVCDDGEADCDGVPENGCEANLQTDVMNCGACGYFCGVPRAVAACEAGQCAVGSCDAGYADCNENPVDGCEALVGSSGCQGLCTLPPMAAEPVPAEGNCECPQGMACVRGSIEDESPDSEYCFPIPEGCSNGFADCGCMSACVCPETEEMACYDQMAAGGVFILNCPGFPQ
jgi:hypothetical protein